MTATGQTILDVTHTPATFEVFRPEDDGAVLNRLAGWTRNRTELKKILVDNAARLYQF